MHDVEPQDAGPDAQTFRFGPFRFTPGRQLLLRDGAPVRIGARAIDILTLLCRRAGAVVSKADLLQFAWPATFVDESNLKVTVSMLRRILSGGKSGDAYIATVPGRGYKFVAPIVVEAESGGTARFAPLPGCPSLIGRTHDLALLGESLRQSRCVTVVGPGGVGKTAVAVAAAHRMLSTYRDGAAFVDLSTIADARYAAAAIALAVGARQAFDESASSIVEAIQGRQALLVLDNCEHVLSTVCSIVDRLLGAVPDIAVLATSREPLRVARERVHPLAPLEVPRDDRVMTAEHALAYPSVQLFVARSSERGDYTFGPVDAPLVAAICRRLDGIPLAIELAASKTAAVGASKMLGMLEQRFRLLSNGPREAPLRQQTLQATLDWSYRLLSDDEATLLRHLSVFAGSFRMEDVVAMAEAPGFDPERAIGALERLVARCLVTAEYHGGGRRYRLLETTRAYAAERLVDNAELAPATHRYARHILALFETADQEWARREKQGWIADYASRIDDLRKVLSWAFGSHGDRRLGAALTAAAIPLWDELSAVSEARARVETAFLAIAGRDDTPLDITVKLAASRASGMNFAETLVPEAEQAWLDCYALGARAGSLDYQLRGLWGLAIYLIFTGRPGAAIARLEQFMTIATAHGDLSALPEGERTLATAEIYVGRLDSARRRLEPLAARYREPTDQARIARFQLDRFVAIQGALALLHWVTGEPARAARAAGDALARAQAIDHIVSQSNALALAALPLAIWSGDLEAATRYQRLLDDNGRREDIPIWRPVSRFFESAIRAKRGERGASAQMRGRLEELVAARFVMRAPMYYCMLAETLLAERALDDARHAAREARRRVAEHGEVWCLAEVLRLEALLHRAAGDERAAEEVLLRAVREARAIGARAFELRAALCLSDLLEDARRLSEAAEILRSSIAGFSREADNTDLAEARRRLKAIDRSGYRQAASA